MNNPKEAKARYRLSENVEYSLRDKDGNLKPLWQDNRLGALLLAAIRTLAPASRYAAGGVRIPFVTGIWTSQLRISNLVTTAGKAGVASRINGSGGEAAFTYIAIGIGTTAAAAGDTALESEITSNGGERANATASRVTTDTANDSARLVNTFTFTGSFAVTESGVLNAGSGGTLLARQVFSAVNVVSGDTLQVTWTFDVD